MKGDGKLSLALHALGHLALANAPLTSELMAAHFGTNPVVVRRVLGLLRDAGLVRSGKGHAGGWRLARPPASVSVAEVQAALGARLLAAPPEDPTSGCAIERALRDAVGGALLEAEAALTRRLAAVTLADLAAPAATPPQAPT